MTKTLAIHSISKNKFSEFSDTVNPTRTGAIVTRQDI